ncbi:hypothetical protein L0F63_002470 [Massospora cicadina]|nr:hypothetical protein L0F63_002470 [Massospora cicadina]
MNLGYFKWKLSYGSKAKNVFSDDQNSSLLFEEPESPTPTLPQLNTQAESTVLFKNDTFDDFPSPPKSSQTFDLLALEVIYLATWTFRAQPKFRRKPSSLRVPCTLISAILPPQRATIPFGEFTEVALKPEADDFGDFFSSTSQTSNKNVAELVDPFNRTVPTKPSRMVQPGSGFSSYASSAQPEASDKLKSEFATDFWPGLVNLALKEFSSALLFLSDLDRVSTSKDRQLLGEYLPLKAYVEGELCLIDV